MNKSKLKINEKGITLVALVITIIVLLILAGVAINMAINSDGLFGKANEAVEKWNTAVAEEDRIMQNILERMNETNGGTTEDSGEGGDTTVETIPTETSYVGYYANLDSDAEPEGIIYADLATGGSGQWSDSYGVYSYSAITGTKNYYVSTESYDGAFGEKPVLTATGSGADRFYIMALEDIKVDTTTTFHWYRNWNMSDCSTITLLDFGTGKTNTSNMINNVWGKTNSSGTSYGETDTRDVWGVIQDKVAEGWFVPSRGEWGAFGNNLGITYSNYEDYSLSGWYWSSSGANTYQAYYVYFCSGYVNGDGVYNSNYVRLSATF